MFSVELPCSQSSVVSLFLYLCSENHPHHGFTEVRATAFQTLYRMTKLKSEMNFTHAGGCKRPEFDPWVGKNPWRRAQKPTPVFLPGESHGQRSLVGYDP